MKNHILFYLLIVSCLVNAQQPSYFKLGEEELSGINIYDIIQDKNQQYWFATSQGIIKFNGYSFERITCPDMLSNSVFDLQLDYDNSVFCKNLSGQIFQIKNNLCSVFFQVPDSLITPEIYYSFDNNNHLIVITNTIIKVKKNGDVAFLEEKIQKSKYFLEPSRLRDSSIIFYNYRNHEFLTLKDDILKTQQLEQEGKNNFFIKSFYLNNKLHYYDIKTGKLLNNIENNISIISNFKPVSNEQELLRYYADNNNLWIARQAGGVMAFDAKLHSLYNGTTIFRNNIIASFCKDNEGNILLGTFGEGLIIIPNLNLVDIKLPDLNAKITRVTSTNDNNIFLGTQDGRIYKIDSSHFTSIFIDKQNKNIEVLEYLPESNELLFDDKSPNFLNLTSKKLTKANLGAIKDFEQIAPNRYLLASNRGVSSYTFNPKKKIWHLEILNNFVGRTNCVNFDSSTKTIYAGTVQGLKIGNDKHTSYYTHNNKALICKDILYYEGRIYITTQNDGVLVFKNNRLIDQWTTEDGLISNATKQIKDYKGKLFLSTNLGLQILNENGAVLHTLNKSEGIYTNNIIDFEIRNDQIWMVHQKGIQTIKISDIKTFDYAPTITFEKLKVNDSTISIINNSVFEHTQNRFEFHVHTSNIKYKNEIKYYYQLNGIDKGWQINNYDNKKIEYKSLPPGKYSFKIKAVCRLKESQELSYNFTITKPIWQSWWFYLTFSIIGGSSTIIFFRIRIRRIKYRTELEKQLKVSEITAIKAQMNPHFIFNAINSIQDLILKGDIDNSYNYIIKFSQLVRQTLDFSDKEFIDIEDEIQLLEVYLELEKLRFKDDFEYTINLNNANDLKVPPMLIQPFVENAIKHGLLHREGLKKLDISFEKDAVLKCIVTDNGIGRKEAQEIKERQRKNHKSFSINAIKNRFEIMKAQHTEDLGINYSDILINNEIKGTKVIIKLPFKQRY